MISQRDISKGKVLMSACAIIEGEEEGILFIYEGDMPYHNLLEAIAYKWLTLQETLSNPEVPNVFKRVLHTLVSHGYPIAYSSRIEFKRCAACF